MSARQKLCLADTDLKDPEIRSLSKSDRYLMEASVGELGEIDATTAGKGLNRRGFLGWGAAGGGAIALVGLAHPVPALATTTSLGSADPAQAAKTGAPGHGKPAPALTPPPVGGYQITAQALGVNTTSGDGNFADAVVPGLLTAAGIGRIRYPGGGGADDANWLQSTVALPWPEYVQLLAQIGAAPMITVNYGQLTQGPASAAAWVGSALTFPNYSAKTAVWVLGNEGYGPWENDQHPDPHTPKSYATNVRPYFEAMHAVDPATRVGFPMTIDRTVSGGTGTWVADPDLWNRVVLKANADQVDFVDFHWYPIFGIPLLTNQQLFETVDRIPGAVSYLKSILNEYDPNTPIVVSESNISQSEIVYNAQPVGALYAVTTALRFLSNGAESYMWWQVHNSDNENGDFGFLSNGSGTPGPTATTLSAASSAGDRFIQVTDASGLHYAHQFTIDTGSAQESRKITALPGTTTLAAATSPGAKTINVAATFAITTEGSDTNYQLYFAPGTPVDVDGESRVVTSVGTAAGSGTLAAPASAGDKTVNIVGTGMGGQSIPVFVPVSFVPGATITVGSGADVETATIAQVGTSSSLGTTLVAPAAKGDTTLHVASVTNTNTGIANYVGDPITVDTGSAEEVRTITAVGSSAASATTLLTAVQPGTRTLYLASVTGATVGHPIMLDTGSNLEIVSEIASVGTQTTTQLAAASAVGDTNVKVVSVTGFAAWDPIAVGTGSAVEVRTITRVGTAGATGTGITLSAALSATHAVGNTVLDAGFGVILSSPVTLAHAAGAAARDLGSGIKLSAPLSGSHPIGVATRDAGSGLVLSRPLKNSHPDGDPISTVGTGITLNQPLTAAHGVGAAVATTAVTITPALASAHGSGTAVAELGLKEPALDTPLPAYWGFVLASKLAAPGAKVVDVTPAGSSPVYAFASYLSGVESVALVNTDDANPVTVSVTGLSSGSLTTWDYGLENPQVVQGTAAGSQAKTGITLAPESIKILVGNVGARQPEVSVQVRS
jgi:hypothetical protein